jgi:hypothetical protein
MNMVKKVEDIITGKYKKSKALPVTGLEGL